jgi:hypothetical protein
MGGEEIMAILYSCRHDGDQYRITKFDEDFNIESSYLCTIADCECPAGVRPMCRHREMLPKFLSREAVGTGWMYDYDRGGWVDQRWMVEEVPSVEYPSKELQADLDEFLEPNIPHVQMNGPKRKSWRRF